MQQTMWQLHCIKSEKWNNELFIYRKNMIYEGELQKNINVSQKL